MLIPYRMDDTLKALFHTYSNSYVYQTLIHIGQWNSISFITYFVIGQLLRVLP